MEKLESAWMHPDGRRACIASAVSALCTLFLIYCVSVTRSLVLTSAAWQSVFSFFSLISTIISLTVTHKASKNNSFGFIRAPVLAVFSTTVLATLSAVFLVKECIEHLLDESLHQHPHRLYLSGALSASLSLLLAAYSVKNQPFQHVLTASSSSSLQEHFADVSHAVCYILPGLSVLLLPRLNAMSLLAFLTCCACAITNWFLSDVPWIDAGAALILSVCVFLTMFPLSSYAGRILLQTSPSHIHNQLDRCISEASTIDGVLELRSAHFWQLDFDSMFGTVDVRVRRDADEQRVLVAVTGKLSAVVSHLTVQIVKDISTSWSSHDLSSADNIHSLNALSKAESVPRFNIGSEHGHSHENGGHSHSHNEACDHDSAEIVSVGHSHDPYVVHH
ncbi:hypothetical protein AB6A40_003666 [Gnathostoma spinigerum]|uniref:Cation efflux protein transmembrane domain-containing protein n=1 Tax=Gnathostoma spinigerum TaxID=75299 RepID=A0ABD6EK62_9BILA